MRLQRYVESLASDIEATTDFLAVGVSLSLFSPLFLPNAITSRVRYRTRGEIELGSPKGFRNEC